MQDSAPDPASGSSSAPTPPGLTRFLAESPSSVGVSREALSEAVHSLLRERDYLRRARDLQRAEHESELAGHRRHAGEMERLREEERRAYQEQVDALRRELIAHQEQADGLRRELIAHQEQAVVLRRDRDAWRARANRSLPSRVWLTLRSLLRKAAPGRRPGRGGEGPPAASDAVREA